MAIALTRPIEKDLRWVPIPHTVEDRAKFIKDNNLEKYPDYPWDEIPFSELAMHVRMAGKTLKAVMVSVNGNYAHVLATDNSWTHGTSCEVMCPAMAEWAKRHARVEKEDC